ncbi:hypothetical protein U716_10730 [Rhodobacter capsulatus B6]|nr:hypothetical protein U716_10730 [Rhodobacter capsulatus B6]
MSLSRVPGTGIQQSFMRQDGLIKRHEQGRKGCMRRGSLRPDVRRMLTKGSRCLDTASERDSGMISHDYLLYEIAW